MEAIYNQNSNFIYLDFVQRKFYKCKEGFGFFN